MKKITIILFTSIICLCIGTAFAYYNTASLGYDNAVLLSVDENEIKVMDFVIKYKSLKQKAEKILENDPPDFITI